MGDVAESEAEPAPAVTRSGGLSCGFDAPVWLPTGFATVKIFQQPGQGDHGARDALHDWTLKSHTSTPPCTQ